MNPSRHDDAALGADLQGFRALGETEIHQGYVMRLVAARFESPTGEQFQRDVVRSPGAVAVVPVLQGSDRPGPVTVLVRQFRAAVGQWLWEIPAGLRDKPGEPVEDTARRELIEETGFDAARLDLLVSFYNAAGMTDQRTHIFMARDLSQVGRAADGIEEAFLEVHEVPFSQVPAMIASGEVCDAKTIIGLTLAAQLLSR
ncbi:MAG: NUDIX hydrolase [Acidimicrobiales bacterium]